MYEIRSFITESQGFVAALLCTAVLATAAQVSADPPASPTVVRETERFESLLGTGVTIREVARLTTDKGEQAAIVLYLTDAAVVDRQQGHSHSCATFHYGESWIWGESALALFIENTLINRIDLGHRTFALTIDHGSNRHYWGEPNRPRMPSSSNDIEPVTLMRLSDYTGDGNAWEFRIVEGVGSCGHNLSLLYGYSARRRQLIKYPIYNGTELVDEEVDIFPGPLHIFRPGHARSAFMCRDHGSDVQNVTEYAYDNKKEAWFVTRSESRLCKAAGANSDGMPAFVYYVGSTMLEPGTAGDMTVELRPIEDLDMTVDLELVFDLPLQVTHDSDGRPECHSSIAGPDNTPSFRFTQSCDGTAEGATCVPKQAITASIRVTVPQGPDVPLFRCRIAAPRETMFGGYPVWVSRIGAIGTDGKALKIDGQDGGVGVGHSTGSS